MRDRAGRAAAAAPEGQAVGRHEPGPHQASRSGQASGGRAARAGITLVGPTRAEGGRGRRDTPARPTRGTRPATARRASWWEDLVTGWCSLLLVLGLYLDGWSSGERGSGGPTLWQGLLYLGFSLTAAWILTRNQRPGAWSLRAVPAGYRLALAGVGLAAADVAVALLRPSPQRRWAARAVAVIAPGIYWTSHFAVLGAGYGVSWAPEIWLGSVVWAGLSGLTLAWLMWPPAVPLTAWRGRAATRRPATPAPMPARMVGR